MKSSFDAAFGPRRFRMTGTAVVVLTMLLLAGCGGGKDKGASQTAAKVNKEEITVHQINFVLQQQRGLKPEQADAASRQILDRLIDQELAVQKAEDLKLDREPRVVQTLEAAKRDILARAYVEKASESAAKPTPQEVAQYYNDKPALFKDRRIYNIQELAIEAAPAQIATLRSELANAKTVNEFVDYLKSVNIRFAANQAVRAAEQLPLATLDMFAKMKDGQAVLVPSATGAQVIVLAGSRAEPVDEARAKPAIEQYLYNEARRKAAEADMKALRTGAKIEYVGKFAQPAASASTSAPAAAAADPASAAPPAAAAAPLPVPAASTSAPGPARAASGLDAASISKGLGLK